MDKLKWSIEHASHFKKGSDFWKSITKNGVNEIPKYLISKNRFHDGSIETDTEAFLIEKIDEFTYRQTPSIKHVLENPYHFKKQTK